MREAQPLSPLTIHPFLILVFNLCDDALSCHSGNDNIGELNIKCAFALRS